MAYRRGVGQVSSALQAAPVVAATFSGDCSANPCTWMDELFYPSDACASWYASCDPTSAFNVLTTQGLVAGGGTVVGSTVGTAAGNAVSAAVTGALAPVVDATSVPTWVWVAGIGVGALILLPDILKAIK